ncbi:MAG TPA: PDZ domain-containing protein [Myxococcota bacterium]|nr:PDZ domain-containing protein [Myxococcota bacterium]
MQTFSFVMGLSAATLSAHAAAAREHLQAVEAGYVGVILVPRSGDIVIVDVLPGSPAEQSGVRGGDVLDGIDGRGVAGASFDEVTAWLQGPAGAPVTLDVRRDAQRLALVVVRPSSEASAWPEDPATHALLTRYPALKGVEPLRTWLREQGLDTWHDDALDTSGRERVVILEEPQATRLFIAVLHEDVSSRQVWQEVRKGWDVRCGVNRQAAVAVAARASRQVLGVVPKLQDANEPPRVAWEIGVTEDGVVSTVVVDAELDVLSGS